MNYDSNNTSKRENNRAFAGLFLVALGAIYLLRQLDLFLFPGWLFSWPMILIIVGVASGIRHNFTRPGAYIMILIGSIFLIGHIIGATIYFFWPLIMIAIGVSLLLGKNGRWNHQRWESRHQTNNNNSIDL